MQTKIAALTEELCHLSDYKYYLSTHDEFVETFKWQIYVFSDEFRKNLDKWSALDTECIEALLSGETTYLLHLELASELVNLLLDEYGQRITVEAREWAQQISRQIQEIRALINLLLARPAEARLPSNLDSPVIRHQLSIDFDHVLCQPVTEMIALVEELLVSENLDEKQRKYLSSSLRGSRQLHDVLQTARPLILSQNFRALAQMSHSYRSPFCGITGYFLLLLDFENEGLQETQLITLASLRDYAHTILPMVSNLIRASNLIAGLESPMQRGDWTVHESLNSLSKTIELIQERFPKTQVRFNIPEELLSSSLLIPNVEYDCLDHILENAFKYCPEGSICIDVELSDAYINMSVGDTGIGIPESDFEYIFEPFSQTGEQKKGLGLGLYLARQAAEHMGCQIGLESQLGKGSRFTVKIPVINLSEETQTKPLWEISRNR